MVRENTFQMWPDMSSLVTTVRPLTLTASTPAANDNDILDYYFAAGHNRGWIVAPGLQSPAEIEAHTYRGAALDLSATLDSDTLPREAVSGDALTVSARSSSSRQAAPSSTPSSDPGEKQLLPDNGGPAVQHQRLR